MIATITPLPARAGDTPEPETHDRKPVPFHSLEAGPARDNFVAQTAVKIDQLQAGARIQSRKLEELAGKVGELQEACALEDRWYGFHQSEKRARENKLDEMVRAYRDVKTRLDRIESRSGGDYHAYNSFEALSRKLAELDQAINVREQPKAAYRRTVLVAILGVSGLAIVSLGILMLSAELISHGAALTDVLSAPAQIG